MATKRKKRMRRKNNGWINPNDIFFTNNQIDKMKDINKRVERHNRVMEKGVDILNNSSFGDGSTYEKVEFLDYRKIKTEQGKEGVYNAMKKFNRTLDKYGNYKQAQHQKNFKRALIREAGYYNNRMHEFPIELKRVLQKINQLEAIEFDLLSRVNSQFTITYTYYDEGSSLENIETTLDEYLKSNERVEIRKLMNRRKI